MPIPRFRLFAGPNGSGKTYVFKKFREEKIIHTEIYVNADRIESGIRRTRKFSFNSYRVKVDESGFKDYIRASGLFVRKIRDPSFIDHFSVRSGVLHIGNSIKVNSYHASFIATYLAERLFESRQSFAFETVMSHPSKVRLLEQAKTLGYKTYFYFVFTDDIQTNLARIKLRVLAGGHDVPAALTTGRAPRVFNLMPQAFEAADSAYVIDNSDEAKTVLMKESNMLYKRSDFPSIIRSAITRTIRSFSGVIKEMK